MAKIWSEENVKKKLNENKFYKNFFDEFKGGFSCIYNIDGVGVVIFNEIGGSHISVYFMGILSNAPNIESAQSFASLCYKYLNKKRKKLK